MAETIKYMVMHQVLNPRTATRGDVCPAVDGIHTAIDLWGMLLAEGVINGKPEQWVIHGNLSGRVSDWAQPLNTKEAYVIAPNVQGLELPLWAIITGLVLAGAGVGYSVYAYMDMKNILADLQDQDPTRDDGAKSQAYSYASKENYRTDNLPVPVVYGRTKVGGVVINELQYGPYEGENESYKVELALAEGPITGIDGATDIFLDDAQLTEFTNYEYEVFSGTTSPSASTAFPALYQQHFPQTPLTDSMCLLLQPRSTVMADFRNVSWHQEIGNVNNETPTYTTHAAATMSTSQKPAGFAQYSLYLSATSGKYRFGQDFGNFFEPGASPFAIEFWQRFTTVGWAAMGTVLTTAFGIMHNVGSSQGAGDGREWHIRGLKRNSTELRYCFQVNKLSSSGGRTNKINCETVAFDATAQAGDWHHYKICRDGDFIRWYVDGVDKTKTGNTTIEDDSDVYSLSNSSRGAFSIGYSSWNSNVNIGFPGYYCDLRFDIDGNISYDDFTVPSTDHPTSADNTDGEIISASRGYADGLIWQYRFPGGLYYSGPDGTTYAREGAIFKEKITRSDPTTEAIYLYNDKTAGAGHSTGVDTEGREVFGRNNSILIRQHEVPFDYIKVESSSGDWTIGDIIEGGTSGHRGLLVAYRYDGTYEYLYLKNPTGVFQAAETVTSDSGITATISFGGDLVTHTQYDTLTVRRASPAWDHSFRKARAEIKSVTEVRQFREKTALTGVALTYPHTARLVLDIKAQKGLTSIPKVNAVINGFTTKTLYRWDSTAEALTSIGVKNLNNPAWACWDMLTDGFWSSSTSYARGYTSGKFEGYGRGRHPKYLDYDSFSSWADYCTANVNGVPRCRVNIAFDEKGKRLWDALESVAIIGRGRLVPIGDVYYAKVDRKISSAVMTVGAAQMVAGSYKEEYIDEVEKNHEINLDFHNEDNRYAKDTVGHAVSSWDDISAEKIFKTETVFVKGITNPAQAQREAILRLQKSQAINKKITFSMDVDAINWEVGDVIQVQHHSNVYSYGGVCLSVGTTFVQMDRDITMNSFLYSTFARLAWRRNETDTWGEVNVKGPWNTPTDRIHLESAPGCTPGDPIMIGRHSSAEEPDFDLIRVEEMTLQSDMRIEVIGFNYSASVYTHTDYGTTEI